MNLESKFFNLEKQGVLLYQILRLSKVGINQREIASQLVQYGSSIEKKIGNEIFTAIDNGDTFSSALKPWFNRIVWESILAGEISGDWNNGIKHAIETIHLQNVSTIVLIKTLMKPILGLIGLLFACACSYWYFFPMMSGLLPMAHWGGMSIAAYKFGYFWATYGSILLGVFLSTIITIMIMLPLAPIANGRLRQLLDLLPIFSHYRLILATNLFRSMSNLTRAGIPLLEAIEHIEKDTSLYMKWHLSLAQDNINTGNENIGDILNTGLIDEQNIRTLKILGTTGDLFHIFLNASELHSSLLESKMLNMKVWGANIIKIVGLIIGLITGGGIAQLITDMVTNIHI
ncbi:type II secretion system F family protein [Vibrio algicola]|uniref:hypothetical protein n=1 Tax=Vibrio algicola TaxID=2662262 RepID=UPI0015B64721|nr:hypothetical protein [Vibrio algicola]